MKEPERYGIVNGCGYKKGDPMTGADDPVGWADLRRGKYGCVSPEPMHSMNRSGKAGHPQENKNRPNIKDPTL